MPERIDTKAALDGINAAIRGEGKPSAETLLAWWKALAQEIADRETAQGYIEAMEGLMRFAPTVARIVRPGHHRLAKVIEEETTDEEKTALIGFEEELAALAAREKRA